jgi:hypothetical protein
MAYDCGGCLQRERVFNPGKLVRYPHWSAVSRVDNASKKNAAWAKATKCAGVADPMALLAYSIDGCN